MAVAVVGDGLGHGNDGGVLDDDPLERRGAEVCGLRRDIRPWSKTGRILIDSVYPLDIPRPMRTTLQRWGNSQGVRLPKSIVESLGIRVGAPVLVEVSGDHSRIVITPAKESRPVRGRHRIEALIAESAPNAFAAEHDWGKPHGKEVW